MTDRLRVADLVVRSLAAGGAEYVFALSGNQIMPIFDACIDSDLKVIHVRHEAAAVHMADAWGRLTGVPGIALVTAGPGHANALSALYVARMAESPMVLLSGHAPQNQLGCGAFQEMAQAEMASHVCKASWQASRAELLGQDIARAIRLAKSGRPGPVHVSLPFDLLVSELGGDGSHVPPAEEFQSTISRLDVEVVGRILDVLAHADKPLILGGPTFLQGAPSKRLADFAEHTGIPTVATESPRGINDPSLGAFAEVLAQADAILLIGKKLDFTLKFGGSPAFDSSCQFLQIDPEATVLDQTRHVLEDPSRLHLAAVADPISALDQLMRSADSRGTSNGRDWCHEVQMALAYRPPEWPRTPPGESLHAVEIGQAVNEILTRYEASVFISDGGEFGQWAQALVAAPHRLINGSAGSIGTSIPFALAARLAFPDSKVVTMLGDGTFGFHGMEYDTAIRYGIPFVAVVGNDATWNAEYQIQLRDYGPDRLSECELLPTRYDEVVQSLGGYGLHVASSADLVPALESALESNRPACVNVAMARSAAPVIRRGR